MIKVKQHKRSFLFLILLLLLIALLLYFALTSGSQRFAETLNSKAETPEMFRLWDEGKYSELFDFTRQQQEIYPLDKDLLFLEGASSFYIAISRISTEEKMDYLNHAILTLRKLITLNPTSYLAQAHYLLGKAYLGKGSYYADLAVKNLLESIQLEYVNTDSYEYLAEAYSLVGEYEKSLFYLHEVLEYSSSDKVLVKLAENSYLNSDYQQAEDFFLKALEQSQDEILKKDVLFQLGSMYFNLKNYIQAEKVLSQYLEIDYNNRDAHFMLGETYFYLGDNRAARLEWHRAERIDPYYRPVLIRLYN